VKVEVPDELRNKGFKKEKEHKQEEVLSPLAYTQRLQQNTKLPERPTITPTIAPAFEPSKIGYSSLLKTGTAFYKTPSSKQSPSHAFREKEDTSSSKKMSVKSSLKGNFLGSAPRKK